MRAVLDGVRKEFTIAQQRLVHDPLHPGETPEQRAAFLAKANRQLAEISACLARPSPLAEAMTRVVHAAEALGRDDPEITPEGYPRFTLDVLSGLMAALEELWRVRGQTPSAGDFARP